MATYSLETFVRTPVQGDVSIKIYDKYNKLKYTFDPNIAFFYKTSNLLMIKVEDKNDIILDFETATECSEALIKLNTAKQTLVTMLASTSGITDNKMTIYSNNNLNMESNITINDGDLACDTAISDIPVSNSQVRVMINGIEVNVGGKVYPFDCYFSNDGITVRTVGDERQGDKLYWNQSIAGYNLDQEDLIDFIYLIVV